MSPLSPSPKGLPMTLPVIGTEFVPPVGAESSSRTSGSLTLCPKLVAAVALPVLKQGSFSLTCSLKRKVTPLAEEQDQVAIRQLASKLPKLALQAEESIALQETILSELLAKGQGGYPLVMIISKLAKNLDFEPKILALNLLNKLLDNERMFMKNVRAASPKGQYKEIQVQIRCEILATLTLFVTRGFDVGENPLLIATSLVIAVDKRVRRHALILLKALVDRGQGIKEARSIATTYMKDDDDEIFNSAVTLSIAVCRRNGDYQQLLTLAKQVVNYKTPEIIRRKVMIFEALLGERQGVYEAEDVCARMDPKGKMEVFNVLREGITATHVFDTLDADLSHTSSFIPPLKRVFRNDDFRFW